MSKKSDNPKIQALIYFFVILVMSFILFPLLDMFWCAIITHSEFTYKPQDYLLEPIFFSIIMTFLFYLPVITRHKTKK